MKNLFQIL